MISKLKKISRYLKWKYFLYSNKYIGNISYYVLNFGIGDTYLVSSLMPAVLAKRSNIVLLIEKDSHLFIPHLFDENIEVRKVSNLPYELMAEFGGKDTGMPTILHPSAIKNISLTNLLGYKGYNLIDVYKLMLGLNLEENPREPSNLKNDEFDDCSSNNRVLLCPQANSIGLVDDNFWIGLANFLIEKNFKPIFMNVSYVGFESIQFPLDKSIQFCNKIKGVISLRSGFCDLISSCEVAKIVLYPKIVWYSGSLLQSSSLEAMGIGKGKLLEIETSDFVNNLFLFNQIENFLNE